MRKRSVSAADANRHFSKLLRAAMEGETVVVTMRSRPVAEIRPAASPDNAQESDREQAFANFLDELRSRPVLDAPRMSRDDFYD